MKILVCGGAGFIGSALVPALAGHEVSATLFSRDPVKRTEGVRYVEVDLSCRAGWDAALICKPEIVYMCAGKTGGSGLDPLHFVTDNALMALHMFRSCAERGVKRIVYMSSTTGYPEFTDDGNSFMYEENFFEGEPHAEYFNPGHTKRFIERLGAMYPQIETVFIRVPGVYGPGSDFDPRSSHVIEATIRKVAERQDPITVWGDGTNVRDALYIDDLTDALVRAAAWPVGAYNLGTGAGISVNEMLHVLLEYIRHTPVIKWDASKRQMLTARRVDCTKARAAGWKATVPMREGLLRTLAWYEAQRTLNQLNDSASFESRCGPA